MSEAVEPIIYYMGLGAPEPVKSQLMEGAAWWSQAFEAVGYKDAFQVQWMSGLDSMGSPVYPGMVLWVFRN